MSTLFGLSGRVVLVTGGSRGLGLAMARALADAGARVVLVARRAEPLAQAVAEIRAAGGDAHAITCDLLDEPSITALVPRIVREHGRIDVLLNNAGICLWSAFLDSTLQDWQRTFATNLTPAYVLAQAAARPMIDQGWGRIINVGSYVSVIGRERLQAYTASKHALVGLTKSIAGELGRHGVTCNAIAPGFFVTEMAEPVRRDPARCQVFTNAIALGRWGAPSELAGPVVFLASDASSYVNGHTLHVDGGVAEVLSLAATVTD